MKTALIFAALVAAAPCAAQETSAEGHVNYARTTHTHLSSWGVGGSVLALWGSSSSPLRIGTSPGLDWMKQENNGPSQTTLGLDVTVQPGGSSAITPYAGGNVSANWLSGGGSTSDALLGLQYLLGVQIKPESQGPLSLKVEVRPGYVRTQEHAVNIRAGISFSL